MPDFMDEPDNYRKPFMLNTYRVHLHVIQNLSNKWHFVIEFYPDQGHDIIHAPIMIVSQATFPVFEYAIESGIDALETFGYVMSDTIAIDVYEARGTDYNLKLVLFDGDEFSTQSETLISHDEYHNQYKDIL